MADVQPGGLNSYPDARETRLAHLAERSIGEWEAAEIAQRLIEFDAEAGAHMTEEEYSESIATVLAQHEERTLARYHALQHRNDSDVDRESPQMRSRSLDSQFGSDGNQYNPYAPHTSEEYMLQEIEAGRMDPEMMDIPRYPSNPALSLVSGNGPGQPLAHLHAGDHVLWMASGHRPRLRQGLNGPGVPVDLSDPREVLWFPRPSDGGAAAEDVDEEEYPDVYPAMLPHLDMGVSPVGSHMPSGTTPNPVFPNPESPFDNQGPLVSSLGPPNLNEVLTLDVPRQPHPASTGRERKRLAKPSLVVKLKTDSAQRSSQAPVSLRRVRSDASSSSESSSATQTSQPSRPFNLRSRGSAGLSPTNSRARAGCDPQSVRRVTRRAEAIQSSHRKRRRDAVSPQNGCSTESTTTPTAALPEGK